MPALIALDTDEIKRRYRAGQSSAVIAEAMGCSPRTLRERLTGMGVELRATSMPRRPAHASLYCANDHDHVLAPEQAERLYGTPCCWCRQPMLPGSSSSLEKRVLSQRGTLGSTD